VDSLVGDTLISLLRQIRAGYPDRPHAFPQTVLLCGVQVTASTTATTKSSPAAARSTSNRSPSDWQISAMTMYAQHTEETGQAFESGVIDYVFEQTNGQPWLVNALANEACFEKG